MDDQTRDFLIAQFPEKQWSELQSAFGWIFVEGRFPVVPAKTEWEVEIKKIDSVVAKLKKVGADILASDVTTDLHELPPSVQEIIEDAVDNDVGQLIALLKNYAAMSTAWHKLHPRTGGTNPEADLIADAVKLAFEDLGIRPTYGNHPKGSRNIPSTRYGRVVEEALAFHGSPADWRRPTQRAVRGILGTEP